MNVKTFIRNFIITKKHARRHKNNYLSTPKIKNTQNEKLIKEIEITEIQQALQTMENRKSPGIDGIPVEFYQEFFDLLKKDLKDIFNNDT